jgi:ribonuclease P protein component
VVLYVAPGSGNPRAAWVAGKRVGGAVARNRARRLFRETWRSLAPQVREGNDLVFVARGPFGGIRAPELIEEVENPLRGAGVMRS